MERRVFISIVTVILLCAGHVSALENIGQTAITENRGPRIEVKELHYDSGKVVAGTQVSHIFEVKNTGSEQLVIKVQST